MCETILAEQGWCSSFLRSSSYTEVKCHFWQPTVKLVSCVSIYPPSDVIDIQFTISQLYYLTLRNGKIQQECSSLDTKRRARQSQHYRTSVTWEAQCLENQHTTAELLTSLSLRGLSRAVCPSGSLHSSHSNRQGISHKLSLYSWVNLLLLIWTRIHWFTFADNLFGQQIIRMQFNSVTSNI